MKESRLRRRVAVLAGVVIVAFATASITTPSFGAESGEGRTAERPGLIAWNGPLPQNLAVGTEDSGSGEITKEVSDAIWDLELSEPDAPVNTYEWVPSEERLLIYSSQTKEYWKPLLEEYFSNQPVEVVPSVHSKEEIDRLMDQIVSTGGALPDGARIVTAIPEKDGSGVRIGIEFAGGKGATISASTVSASLDTSVPLTVEKAPAVTPAERNSPGSNTLWISGNVMQTASSTPGYISICSTGFRIGRLSDSAPGMVSAEHCGSGKPSTSWNYSTYPPTSANSIGDFQGLLSSGTANSDTALWTGGNVSKLYPAVYVGDYNNSSSADLVRGGNYPAVGTDVCYSGSQSGNVCDNEVLFQGLTLCYAIGQCYQGLTWTSQRSGIEAAGNGDSGGPVYQIVNGQLVASGVISGIVGGSSTCTGEPGGSGRSCSPVALFAPVIAALGSGGSWGLSYVP